MVLSGHAWTIEPLAYQAGTLHYKSAISEKRPQIRRAFHLLTLTLPNSLTVRSIMHLFAGSFRSQSLSDND